MEFTFTITYNDPLVRSATTLMWWRRTGVGYVVALVALGLCETVLLMGGDRSWWVGAIGTVLVVFAALPTAGFLIQRRGSLQRSRELTAGQAELSLSPAGIRFSGNSSVVEYPWDKILYVVRSQEYWLVGQTKSQLFILSLIGFPSEAQEYMLAQVREHGGTVA